MLRKMPKKLLSMFLALLLLLQQANMVLAFMMPEPNAGSDIIVLDEDGNPVEEDWETAFPYGTFVFAGSELTAEEGGESRRITVYRLGGTAGRATAWLQIAPAIALVDEDELSYINAAGIYDYVLEAEDMLPIAAYQPVGRPSQEPLASGVQIVLDEEQSTEEELVLYAGVEADSYQWYGYSSQNDSWAPIDGATDARLVIGMDMVEGFNYRCVYSEGGQAYSTDGLNGYVYQPPAEELPQMPEDIDLNPAQSFSRVSMEEGEFDAYRFALTFAEGEWVKELIFTAGEDGLAEADEFAALTIIGCEGGSVYDTANTVALHIPANGEAEASVISFDPAEYTFDKSALTATLTLTRTGDLLEFLSAGYCTVDGTAVSGEDFAGTQEGVVFFPSGVSEVKLEIELINDGVLCLTPDRAFTVQLTELLGGGDNSSIGVGQAVVNLYNSNTGDGQTNTATMLYTQDAVDMSSTVKDTASLTKAAATPEVTSDTAAEVQPVEAEIDFEGGDGPGEMSYSYGGSAAIKFKRSKIGSYKNNYWQDWAWLAKSGNGGYYAHYDANDAQKFTSTTGNWTGSVSKIGGSSWRVSSQQRAEAVFRATDMTELFNNVKMSFAMKASLVSGWSGKNGASSPYARLESAGSGGSTQSLKSVTYFGSKGLKRHLNYLKSATRDWNITGTRDGRITLGIGREGNSGWDADGAIHLENGVLKRRYLNHDINLTIFTPDDAIIKASASASTIFNSLKPSVSLIAGKSGVNGWDMLYAGSELRVKPAITAAYKLASNADGKLNSSVFLANRGASVPNAALNRADIDSSGAILKLKTSSEYDNLQTDGKYDIYVVYERVQNVEVQLVMGSEDDFWGKMAGGAISVVCARYDADIADAFRPDFKTLGSSSVSTIDTTGGIKYSFANQKNIKSLNFNLPADYVVVFDAISYSGNAEITIPAGRLTGGGLSFVVYSPEYVTSIEDMTASISHIERYIDANGNGKLDGYHDAGAGVFVPEAVGGVKDILMDIVEAKDYEITEFAPIYVNGQYVEQFFKVYYSLKPRSLVAPEGTTEMDSAQVLPAFTTNITNEAAKAKLTGELKGYRFITSGQYSTTYSVVRQPEGWATVKGAQPGAATVKTAGEYSGDGKRMYTAAANMLETVDIPLGGNKNPIGYAWDDAGNKPLLDENGAPYYSMDDWKPQYVNNLLYPFSNPEPIFINDTPLGDYIPVAGADAKGPSGFNVAQLNAFLGSYNANNTVILGVRQQAQTTDEIKKIHQLNALKVMDGEDIVIDGVTVALNTVNPLKSGTIPSSDNLNSMSRQDEAKNTGSGANSGDSANSMKEMNVDMGVKLPSLSFGLNSYVTVIMDGYEVGFSIGVPLFKMESSTKNYTSGTAKQDPARKYTTESKGPKALNSGAMGKIKNAFANPASMINDDAWKDIKNTQNAAGTGEKSIRAGAVEVSISFNVTILFKYNPLDNGYRFSQAMFAVNAGVQFKFTARLTVCPILYAYFIIGLQVQVAGGVLVDRVVALYPEATHTLNFTEATGTAQTGVWKRDTSDTAAYKGDLYKGAKGASIDLAVNSDTFQLTFSGKLGIERLSGDYPGFDGGYVVSDGSSPVVVKLNSKVTGGGNTTIRLTALDDNVKLDKLEQVSSIRNDTYFSGIALKPSLFLEVGVGIGVEVLKAEIYFKASIGCLMTFASRVEKTEAEIAHEIAKNPGSDVGRYKTEPFIFNSMTFRAGIGVRVVLLLFSFEFDAIQFGINYDKQQVGNGTNGFNNKGWKFAWYALNGMVELDAEEPGNGFPGVRISVPGNSFYAQQIFGPEDGNSIIDAIEEMAYNPTDANVPFQISGYASSGDAFKLTENLLTGTDYKLITVGSGSEQTNYILYTVSRQLDAGASTVDSNMLVMSQLVNTGDTVGLYMPGTSQAGYMVVDNDKTGDLDFSAWVRDNVVFVSWVSYASAAKAPTEPTRPDGAPYQDGSQPMDEENYLEYKQPDNPYGRNPVPQAAPKPSDYYITAEEYELLDEEARNNYAQDEDALPEDDYYSTAYESLAEAVAACRAAEGLWAEYQKYLVKKADYDTWYAYFKGLADYNTGVQNQLRLASQNTVVKLACSNIKAQNPAFTRPVIIGNKLEQNDGYKFLPQMADEGSVIFYASSVPMTAQQRSAADQRHEDDYIAATDGVETSLTEDGRYVTATGGDPSAAFRKAYSKTMDDVYGQNTLFNFAVRKPDSTYASYAYEPVGWAESGMRLETVAMTMLDGESFYLAYTASKAASAAGGNAVVKFLYLQRGTVNEFAETIELENAVVLRKLYEGDAGAGAGMLGLDSLFSPHADYKVDGVYMGMNGVYSGQRQTAAVESPYFGNLKFLSGKLGAITGEIEDFDEEQGFNLSPMNLSDETFLLFEMNGNTYIVPQASLASITGEGKGSIIPFFDNASGNGTRGNMTIGADAEGNISAVYTDTMPNTTNNAIFVMKYNPGDGTQATPPSWGEGRLLAMNYMQVYEDAITGGWNADRLEAAYIDKEMGGGLTSFVFSNLAIALGYKDETIAPLSAGTETLIGTNDDGDEVYEQTMDVDEEAIMAMDGEAGQPGASGSTLLIISQGTQTVLEEVPFADEPDTKIIVPATDENGNIDSSTGFYAISFGVGEHSIGEGRITFAEHDFTPGARLYPTVSFKNTGDMPIRGSQSNPITLQLMLTGHDTPLATWKINGMIAVGQVITTYSQTVGTRTEPLPDSLSGRSFYFTLSEDAAYVGDDAYNYSSLDKNKGGTTVEIRQLPELAVEDLAMEVRGISGDSVTIGLDLMAANRGAATAEGTYLQFTCQTGTDEGGNPVYSPLDLTGHNLIIGLEEALSTMDASSQTDLLKGKLYLHATGEGGTSRQLKAGYGRKVTGTFDVPKTAYCADSVTGSLNIKIEIFYSDPFAQQTLTAFGNTESNHGGELNADNNRSYKQLEGTTLFTTPSSISVPVGTTTRLYVPALTTRMGEPSLTVTELSTTLDVPVSRHLGILHYKAEGGYLVITPRDEGEGVIRIADTATNSFVDIAFKATAAGEGINIFNDNDIFTFYTTEGEPHTPSTVGSHKDDWQFLAEQLRWGSGQAPYLNDLCKAKKDASFTFSTMADTVRLYFTGSVSVSSSLGTVSGLKLDYVDRVESIRDGVQVSFSNKGNAPHTVTVTVLSDTAIFDKYTETYGTAQPPTPGDDSDSPQIYWSRNMPQTASVERDGAMTITAFILDDSGMARVALDGVDVTGLPGFKRNSDTFWQFDITCAQNGDFSITATDLAGNSTLRTITADWFKVSAGQGSDIPISLAAQLRQANGSPLPTDAYIKTAAHLVFDEPEQGQLTALERWDAESAAFARLEKQPQDDGGGNWHYAIDMNGVYRIVKYDEQNPNRFAARIVLMDRIDSTNPVISLLGINQDGSQFTYRVAKVDVDKIVPNGTPGVATIAWVKINGYSVDIERNQANIVKNCDVAFNGTYTITTMDTSGNKQIDELKVQIGTLPVNMAAPGTVTVTRSWNQNDDTGAIAVDISKISGGYYDTAAQAADNTYKGCYNLALVPSGETPEDSHWSKQVLDSSEVFTFTGLASGKYDVYARDALAPPGEENASFVTVEVSNCAIKATAEAHQPRRGHLTVAAKGGLSGEYLLAIYKIDRSKGQTADDLGWLDFDTMIGQPSYHKQKVIRQIPNPDYIDDETTPDEPPYIDIEQEEDVLDTNIGVWFPVDDPDSLIRGKVFDGLRAGAYAVVVRDADDNLHAQHTDATWVSAVTLRSAPIPDEEEIEIIVPDDKPDDSPYVIIDSDNPLIGDERQKALIKLNETQDIYISGAGIEVVIPKGTLQPGDSINAMYSGLLGKTSEDGNVVVCTTPDGGKTPVIYSYVTSDRVYVIMSLRGVYTVEMGGTGFADIDGHWAAEAIRFIAARGLFNGVSDSRFSPESTMTRAMFVTVLHRMAGQPAPEGANPFADVPDGAWFTTAVVWAAENGIVTGYTASTFGPHDSVTREQICTIFVRFMDFAAITLAEAEGGPAFVDENQISSWALEAVEQCRNAGLINSVDDDMFDPKGPASRAQVATVFKRFIVMVVTQKTSP